jgi:outer membrane lipoprotein-sorting protein
MKVYNMTSSMLRICDMSKMFVVFMVCLFGSTSSWASSPTAVMRTKGLMSLNEAQKLVEQTFNTLTTLRAEFVQTVTAPNGKIREKSEGVFTLRRGAGVAQFLWQYETPVRQKIVGTGTAVYYVDQSAGGGRDGQVTQLPMDAGLGRLLRGKTLLLSDVNLHVSQVRAVEDVWEITLSPPAGKRGDVNGLSRLIIQLDRNRIGEGKPRLRGFAATDVMGVNTAVRFDSIAMGSAVDARIFRYEPGVYKQQN